MRASATRRSSEPRQPIQQMSKPDRLATSVGVLICDDDAAMRELLSLVVEQRSGMHVLGEAQNGIQAISEALRLQPDVILLDLAMPLVTGLDAIPEIKRVVPDAKVIVLSGFATAAMARDVLAQGADRYLEKGIRPAAIANAIEEVAVMRAGA